MRKSFLATEQNFPESPKYFLELWAEGTNALPMGEAAPHRAGDRQRACRTLSPVRQALKTVAPYYASPVSRFTEYITFWYMERLFLLYLFLGAEKCSTTICLLASTLVMIT